MVKSGGTRCSYGYTLIEVLIVVTIIGTMLAIGIPVYIVMIEKIRSDAIVTSYVQRVFYLFTLARRTGFEQGNIVKITYEATSTGYVMRCFVDSDTDGQPDSGSYLYGNTTTLQVLLPTSDVQVRVIKDGQQLTSITDLYTADGLFIRKVRESQAGPEFDDYYKNLIIEITNGRERKQVLIDNDLPKLIDRVP